MAGMDLGCDAQDGKITSFSERILEMHEKQDFLWT